MLFPNTLLSVCVYVRVCVYVCVCVYLSPTYPKSTPPMGRVTNDPANTANEPLGGDVRERESECVCEREKISRCAYVDVCKCVCVRGEGV